MASLISILPLVYLLFATFYDLGEANKFIVGGSSPGWSVPDPANNTLKHWAESRRFKVGDTLEFYYDIKNDSVLEVTKENYEKCITEKPLKEYKAEQPTMVTLNVSGPHYFISGAPGHCNQFEKLAVVVQSPNHPPMPTPKPIPGAAPPTRSKSPTSPTAPAPAPNSAVGLVAVGGIFWTIVAIIGLAWA